MKFTKKKLALAIGGALITMSVLVSGCSTGSDKKADTIKIGVVAELTGNNERYLWNIHYKWNQTCRTAAK